MTSYAESNPSRLLIDARHRGALGDLVEIYRGYLKVLARIRIGPQLQGKLDSSDVVQEVFLRAQRTFSQFNGSSEQELLTWLRKILAHTLADQSRRYLGSKRRDVSLEQELGRQLDKSSQVMQDLAADAQSTPSEQAERKERAVLLADAIERLPDDYREVVILRHLDQLAFPEVAARMDRSLDSVKNVWTRAIAQLQHELRGA